MSDDRAAVETTSRRSGGGWRTFLDRSEPLIEWVIRLCGWSAIFFIFAILFFIIWEARTALFGGVNLIEFFTSTRWQPTSEVRPEYGILALIVGTVSVTALAMVIAVPLGLGAAVFISEFCSGKPKEILKIVIELLAAIPSIVWGFIGYMVLGQDFQPVLIMILAPGAFITIGLLMGYFNILDAKVKRRAEAARAADSNARGGR